MPAESRQTLAPFLPANPHQGDQVVRRHAGRQRAGEDHASALAAGAGQGLSHGVQIGGRHLEAPVADMGLGPAHGIDEGDVLPRPAGHGEQLTRDVLVSKIVLEIVLLALADPADKHRGRLEDAQGMGQINRLSRGPAKELPARLMGPERQVGNLDPPVDAGIQ